MKRKLLIVGIVIGAILAIGPFLGMMGATFSMFTALHNSGISDPRALSARIGMVRFFRHLGWVVCPVGLGLLILCIIKLQTLRRQPPPLPPP